MIKLISIIKEKIIFFLSKIFFLNKILENQNIIKVNIGALHSSYNKEKNYNQINDYEFKAFSQFGEDGILQFLIQKLDIKKKFFIEFGVENYEEANTRFLLEKDNWQGLIIDSSKKNINYIKNQSYYWRHNLTALNYFVSPENINNILKKNNYSGDIGLLSIDTDGNDYWIWKEIKEIKPIILIIEYNAKLGDTKPLSIKYTPNFQRESYGLKKLIYGASLKALEKVSKEKGYSLVCVNKNGNNAFFVRDDYLNKYIFKKSTQECFEMSQFREYVHNNEQEQTKEINDQLIFDYLIKSGKFIEV